MDGRHYVVAALAIAVSIPSGKTTATRSVRPSTKAPQPANHVVRLRPELAMCDRKAPWPQDGISVRRRSRIMGKKISDARKGAASGFLACRLVLQLISNLRQACPSCLSSYAIDPACQVGAMLHVWTGGSFDRYSITSAQCPRYVEVHCLDGLEVEYHLEFGRELNGQITRLLAAQNPVNIGGGAPKQIDVVSSIGHEAASSGERP